MILATLSIRHSIWRIYCFLSYHCACTSVHARIAWFLEALLIIFVLTVLLEVSCRVIMWQDVYFCILLLYLRSCVTHVPVYL